MTPVPQRRIASYEIVALLGAGGMGEVYRARDTKLNREVALKILPEAYTQDPDRMARFAREAEVLAALNHPNIATIYGIEQSAIVMELIEGEDLQGPLPVETAIAYARQIAVGLEAAHEKGIVHRDLKPANIKVTADGVVKLLDFGLAKAGESTAGSNANSPTLTLSATHAGVILGTAGYMAPEQARGKTVDKRADIWAFGVVLFELLTGKQLFGEADNVTDIIAAVVTREPDWSSLPADTPPHVRRLLERCLRKDPKQRLRDIGDARLAIDEPEAAAAPVVEGRRGVTAWAVALTALASVALAALLWQATRPKDAPSRPMMRFSIDLGPQSTRQTAAPILISPDGTRILFPVRSEQGAIEFASRLLDKPSANVLAGTGGASFPFFSTDGQWIGFTMGGRLKKMSIDGGAAVALCDAFASRGGGGVWINDDTIIANLDGVHLFRVPSGGGQPVQLGKPEDHGDRTWRWPQVLPGVETVLFTASVRGPGEGFNDASIKTYSLKTGQVKTLVHRGGYFGRYLQSGHVVYVHDGTLFAVRFDPTKLETRGARVPILQDVAGESGMGLGEFDFAQNGTFVYWSGKETNSDRPAMWLNPVGDLEPLASPQSGVRNPRLSPDGKLLAFYTADDIAVYDVQRGATSKLTFNGAQNSSPVWTPDGKHVIFVAARGDPGIWWTRADGSGQPQKLLTSKADVLTNSVSPDGRYLAFTQSDAQSGRDLWLLPLDTTDPERPKPGEPRPLLREEGDQKDPIISPDGKWIAYCSNQSGNSQVFVRPFASGSSPGAAQGKWQISTTGGRHPVWSRRSKTIFFLGEGQRIFKVKYTASGGAFVPGIAEPWSTRGVWASETWTFDMAGDDLRAVVLPLPNRSDIATGTVHATVLLNFFDELKRRVP